MSQKNQIPRFKTGIRNFDSIFEGGMPRGSVTVLSGAPGSGKTIFAQQLCFHAASSTNRVLYCNTLSEPTAKTLRYLKQFKFFDADKLRDAFHFVDLGVILRSSGLEETTSIIMDKVKEVEPGIIVLDSFKTFEDLAKSREDLRKFSYELAVNLMAWEATGLLLGEYVAAEFVSNPLFSVVDGHIILSQRHSSGEQQRFVQVVKMRGTDHSRDEHAFVIAANGIEVFTPRMTIHREPRADVKGPRCRTGIEKLDDIIGEGIPRGSSLLVSGVAGTGKSVLSLEFLYRGAIAGEKGILFSFEETSERLLAAAAGMGWNLEHEIDRGMVEVVFIPQPEILVEAHLLMMRERVEALGARRVVVDSVSVFLHKITDSRVAREKVFQLASIVQNIGAVGFFTTDIPYGTDQISRFGVEETVVDGVILLSATKEGLERQRYIEIYKLRNTAHLEGRHNLVISKGGLRIFPRYSEKVLDEEPPPSLETSRLSSGVNGLDALLGGGLFRRSATVIAGSTGIGKSTLGLQFILEGATREEPGLILTLEESPLQLLATADALKLPLRRWVEAGVVELFYVSHEHARAAQLLSVLGDKVRGRKVRRVFLDSATHIPREGRVADQLRNAHFRLVAGLKALDVTSVLAVESASLYFGDDVAEYGCSPATDNLLLLRYVVTDKTLIPALRVIKTRGSTHERGTYTLILGDKGMQIGDRILGNKTSSPSESTAGSDR